MGRLGKIHCGVAQSLVVARGCYCFGICSCHLMPSSIKSVYEVTDILANMSFEPIG